MGLRFGVDTGGTFTDVCAYDDHTGRVHVHKVSSTPDDPGRAIVQGVTELLGKLDDRQIGDITYFAHGTTVGTNTLLTNTGVPTGLITTKGFRDLLELGRGRRPDMYDPQADKPIPLVPRHLRLEVTERLSYDGTVITPLDEDETREKIRELRDAHVNAIAVCFLYSYLDPTHERRVAELIAEEFPEAYVSLSSVVLPEFREYERLSTVVTNAYAGPVVYGYLSRLRRTLVDLGLKTEPQVTQSNGGVIPFGMAEEVPVRLVLSGPSTGVVGASDICSSAGYPDIITFDMGGTSSDISLVQHGEPHVTSGMELDGRPIRSPMLDIHTVGAGGGSIAWIDSGNHLRVGPQSAGAYPGPAAYGNGWEPTVTDANVVLHMLNPEYLLNGQMKISEEAAVAAVKRVGDPLGLEVYEAALGILRVVTANMARAIRVVSVQRGYDPRDYALVPFGGAGPLHASRLARELSISKVVIPEIPGAQSAMGLLMTDVRTDFMRTQMTALDQDDPTAIAQVLEELEEQAAVWFAAEGTPVDEQSLVRRLEMRYRGQNFELPIDIEGEHGLETTTLAQVVESFHKAHERVYGFHADNDPIEVVTFRVQAVGEADRLELVKSEVDGESSDPALVGEREVFLSTEFGFRKCPVYERGKLLPGNRLAGPAIVEQMDTTTVLLPGDACEIDEYRNLVIEIGAQQ